MPNTLGAV